MFHHDLPGPQIPTALSFAPPLQYFKHAATQTLLLISDDSYKVCVTLKPATFTIEVEGLPPTHDRSRDVVRVCIVM
jgi:hypothetical protein